jgi:hypothetical protein
LEPVKINWEKEAGADQKAAAFHNILTIYKFFRKHGKVVY